MTTPDRDGINTYGGPFKNYSPVVDPTTDIGDAGFNQMLESVASLTNTGCRAIAQFSGNGASPGAPSLVSHLAMWGNAPGVAPSIGHPGVGTFTVVWPTTVNDEIQSGTPGFASPHTLNFLYAWANAVSSAAFWHPQVSITSANIATIYLYQMSGGVPTLTDPASGGPSFTVFVV